MSDPEIAQPTLNSELGSSQPTVIREIVPELVSPTQRAIVYHRMMNDAGVDVSMRIVKTPVLGADFYVEPYDDQAINQEISQFIEANLMEGMSAPFANSLEDVLHMFEDGYSVLEKVYEMREWTPKGTGRNTRQYTMLKKLGVRPPTTVKQIVYDNNGGPTEVTQSAIQADGTVKDVTLPITKSMIFTFSRQGGNLQGRSLLRTAYPHWYYKNHMYKIDAVQKERHSLGVPKGKLLPGWTDQDREILRNMLKNLRTNEESFMILVPNVDVEFAEIHGNLVNVLESAVHHNAMILLNVMGQFLVLGMEGHSGSRATGGVQTDIFMKTLRFVANYICKMVNMYLIPELVVWNYPTKSFPQLKARNIGETRDLQMLGSAIANLLSQQGITRDDPTENWIREVFDMPKMQTEGRVNPASPAQAASPDQVAIPTPGAATNGAGDAAQKGGVKTSLGAGNVGKPQGAAQ